MRLICKSRTYQLSVATNKWNADDKINYSHAVARRLPAEVLYDAVYRVTGAVSKIPGRAAGDAGGRPARLAASNCRAASSRRFGRPPRESACECERTSGLQLGPVMALVSGPTLGDAIADPANEMAKLVAAREGRRQADRRAVPPHPEPRSRPRPRSSRACETLHARRSDHEKLAATLAEREAWWKPVLEQKEKEREAAIAKAKAELADYEKEIAPRIAEAEKRSERGRSPSSTRN